MTRKLKNYQGGFSLIGIWPWTGVYAGTTLILSSFTGLIAAAIVTSLVLGLLAHVVEQKYPELNGLNGFSWQDGELISTDQTSETLENGGSPAVTRLTNRAS